ncbi:MAG: TetR/AcrR family transcriptional regulator [Clostridiales bacterium]|nr:TetR/AcrR family transcriptional regulator [Clostridiales bacterium]
MEYENATKKRIRQEALKLFGQKGFENVTLNEICEASGINKHTFYYYFKAKDELLKPFYKIPCLLSASELANIFTNDSYVEQLWLLRKNKVEFIVNSGVTITKQLLIKNLTDDIGTFEISEDHKRLRDLQINIIEKGQLSGEILNKTEPSVLLLLMNQSMYSTIFIWCIKNGSFDIWNPLRYMFEKIIDPIPERCKMKDYKLKEFW